jgi:hypothetical protein
MIGACAVGRDTRSQSGYDFNRVQTARTSPGGLDMRNFVLPLAIASMISLGASAQILAQESAAPAPASPPAAPATPAAVPAAKLIGIAAWSQVVGNSITGKEGRKTLTEYYAPDGTAKSMTDNEISTGKWVLVGETICFQYTDEKDMECYKLEVSGNTLTYIDQKGSGTRYEILKGNPKGL